VICLNNDRPLKLLVLFVVGYIILYFLPGITGAFDFLPSMHPWGDLSVGFGNLDYMFFLIPVPGFFLIYLLIGWMDEYFNTEFGHSLWFPIVFFLMAILAFYVAIFWQNCNLYTLNPSIGGSVIPFTGCSSEAAGKLLPLLTAQFGELLKESAFLIFVLAGILGWASKMILEKIEAEPED